MVMNFVKVAKNNLPLSQRRIKAATLLNSLFVSVFTNAKSFETRSKFLSSNIFTRTLLSLGLTLSAYGTAQAQMFVEDADSNYNVVASNNAQEIINTLFGQDVTAYVVGTPILVAGGTTVNNSQIGFISDLDQVSASMPQTGVLFSTGFISDLTTTNTSDFSGTIANNQSDPQFDVNGNGEFDVASIEFTVDLPAATTLSGSYVFASDEYLEYVNSGVSDLAKVFVDGVNIAKTPSGADLSIDTVNDQADPAYYIDNPNIFPSYNWEPDGFTATIPFSINISAGVHTIKIGIADEGDAYLDSWFIIEAGTLDAGISSSTADLSITKTNTPGVNGELDQAADTVTSGQTTTYTLVVTNNGPDSVTGPIVTDTPTSGLTCSGTDPVSVSGPGAPSASFTIADLTGAGITLGTLADTETATLTYSCEVN